jgi:hypothetical protein
LTNFVIVVTLQKTVGATWTGMYNNFPGGSVSESHVDNGAQVIYTWQSISGQTIGPNGGPYTAVAQFNLIGTAQPTSGDTYAATVTANSGQSGTLAGHF